MKVMNMWNPSKMAAFALIAVTVIGSINVAQALKCYNCDSSEQPSCSFLKPNTDLIPSQDCQVKPGSEAGSIAQCVKIYSERNINGSLISKTRRFCVTSNSRVRTNYCVDHHHTPAYIRHLDCGCDSNLCNGATSKDLHATHILLVLCILGSAFTAYLRK